MDDLAVAQRMLDTFASVGAHSFVVTKTELEWPGHKKVKWGKPYSESELRDKLPAMMRTAAIRRPVTLDDGQTILAGENLIIRPISNHTAFVQLDDLKPDQLDRIRPAVFIMHATSPGNYQGWIAVSGVPEGKEQFKEFMRRVRKAVGDIDKSASQATRLAGTENFKVKYAPQFPEVSIVEAHPGRIMTQEQLEGMGLLAPLEAVRAAPLRFTPRAESSKVREWPSYDKALAGAPPNRDGTGPDRSKADYWWCYLAAQRKWSIEDTEAKLLEVSERARQRVRQGDPGYVRETVVNAAADAARDVQRRGRG